jgi:glycosyltransferase involved in cell wall biosynthesis
VEKYLKRCMDSLLNQTLKDIEIILVDDESPDNCPAMCDEYAKRDSRIKVIHKENGGLGFARNSGLDAATGEFVAFADSDDFVDVNMYETLYSTAKEHDLDTVYCGCNFYRDKLHVKPKREVKTFTLFKGRDAVDSFLLDMIGPEPSCKSDVKYMMSVWRAIYSRNLIEHSNCRFHSERELVSEDIIFHLDYLSKAENVVCLPFCFYFYCWNGVSLTKTYSEEKYDRTKFFLSEVRKRLSAKFSEEQYLFHYKRMLLLYFRSTMLRNLVLAQKKSGKEKMRMINRNVNDGFWSELFVDYPYWKLPVKHRLFYMASKYKFTGVFFANMLYAVKTLSK